jgi:hypothetical protein
MGEGEGKLESGRPEARGGNVPCVARKGDSAFHERVHCELEQQGCWDGSCPPTKLIGVRRDIDI